MERARRKFTILLIFVVQDATFPDQELRNLALSSHDGYSNDGANKIPSALHCRPDEQQRETFTMAISPCATLVMLLPVPGPVDVSSILCTHSSFEPLHESTPQHHQDWAPSPASPHR